MEEKEKNIDESWKDSAKEEKESLKKEEAFVPPVPDFSFFVTTLGIQAAIAMGQIPNPTTNQKEEDPVQARFLIDTLGMLKEKTKGNLTQEESTLLENLLYELRMHYVDKEKK